MYVTTEVGREAEARASPLSVVHHQLEVGSYELGAILHTSYLGPDPNALSMFVTKSNGPNEGSAGSSPPMTYYVAIRVTSVVLSALLILVAMLLRVRRARKKAASISNLTERCLRNQ